MSHNAYHIIIGNPLQVSVRSSSDEKHKSKREGKKGSLSVDSRSVKEPRLLPIALECKASIRRKGFVCFSILTSIFGKIIRGQNTTCVVFSLLQMSCDRLNEIHTVRVVDRWLYRPKIAQQTYSQSIKVIYPIKTRSIQELLGGAVFFMWVA